MVYLWTRNQNRNLSKVGAGTVSFQKSEQEPEPYKIVTVLLQHCIER